MMFCIFFQFAIYFVQSHRNPPVTTPRAMSAPLQMRKHYEDASKKINQDMKKRVEKPYVPPLYIQQLLEREEQQLASSRSTPSRSQQTSAISPKGNATSSRTSSGVINSYRNSARPQTSPGKLEQNKSQTTVSRGGFIGVRQTPPSAKYLSPRGRFDTKQGYSPRTAGPGSASVKRQQQQQTNSGDGNGKQLQRASGSHSPHMQPLLASLIEPKTPKHGYDIHRGKGNAPHSNLPEV